MVTRLAPDARSLFKTAEAQARTSRSRVVEAEHLLLAMCTQPDTDAGHVLASVGLSHEVVEAALDQEFESSLAAASVSVRVGSLGRSSPGPARRLRLSASFKAAMERSVTAAAGSLQIRPAHLLLGVLGAQVGTVPRALRLAGVDQAELATLTRQALAES
jgi:ATP-dependent Clp protease ATP-binding subunit ClpA